MNIYTFRFNGSGVNGLLEGPFFSTDRWYSTSVAREDNKTETILEAHRGPEHLVFVLALSAHGVRRGTGQARAVESLYIQPPQLTWRG